MSAESQICSGKKTAVARECLERLRQLLGDRRVASGELIVGALAGKERPRAADAGPVERAAVGVLAVAVPLIPMPAGPCGVSTLSVASMTFTVSSIRGSSAARSPKRTKASASRLTIEEAARG